MLGERADLQAGPALRRVWRTITRDRDQAQAQGKGDESRTGLKELGLDDTASLS